VAGGPICDEDQSFFASVQMEEESDVGQKPGHSVKATERLIGAVDLLVQFFQLQLGYCWQRRRDECADNLSGDGTCDVVSKAML